MDLAQGIKLDFGDVLVSPRPSSLDSRKDVLLTRTFHFKKSGAQWTLLPIVASNMDATGTIAMAKALGLTQASGCLSKFIEQGELISFLNSSESSNSFFSMGITDDEMARLKAVAKRATISRVSIEVANGYIQSLPKFIADVRRDFPSAVILAGSVCTPEGVIQLLDAGADIARVGIGSGSVCTTRRATGVGYPQLSAVIECAAAAHEIDGYVCSDGGCTVPGDICKAFGAGADFVMLGGMLAGHDESDGEVIYEEMDGVRVPVSKEFYGMASERAQNAHYGGKSSYAAAEGKCVRVPYRGPVDRTLTEILGGLRSMMTYINAPTIENIPTQTRFVQVNRQLNSVFGTS